MPLGRQWGDGSAPLVVDVPESSVRPEKPGRSEGAHDGDASVLRGLIVDVPAGGGRARYKGTNPLHDVLGKDHATSRA